VLKLDRIWAHPASALQSLRAHRSALARVASDHLPLLGTYQRATVTGEGTRATRTSMAQSTP